MNKLEMVKESYRYLCFSILGWDDPNKIVEDKPENEIYFSSPGFKKKLMKEVVDLRSKINKTRFFENKDTSTNFNVYEIGDEVVFSFRGSDSAIDWIMDFTFFKAKFDKINKKNPHKGTEVYDIACFDQYVKSCEGVVNDLAMTFRNSKLINSFRNYKITPELITNLKEESKNIIANLDLYKDKIYLHSGFVIQFNSILNMLKGLVASYNRNPRFKKITFTGHSLGSSLCRLAIISTFLSNPKMYSKIKCYAFGTPRLGNKAFEDFISRAFNMYENKIININTEKDFVKNLPPDGTGFAKIEDNISLIAKDKAPFETKFDHTLFYYLYSYKNGEIKWRKK